MSIAFLDAATVVGSKQNASSGLVVRGLETYKHLGSQTESYFLWSNPDYHIGEAMHPFSVNAFDPFVTGGTLRKINLYMGLVSHFEFDIENPTSSPVHVYYGTYPLDGSGVLQSHSGVGVYYNSDTSQSCCYKDHQWPDAQCDLAPTMFNGTAVFTGPDGFIYSHDCNEIPQLVAEITDAALLALWGPPLGGTVQLGYQPYHMRFIHPLDWGDGNNTAYFFSSNQNQAALDIEFIYSIP